MIAASRLTRASLRNGTLRSILFTVASLLGGLLLWQIAAALVFRSILFPTPVATFAALMRLVSNGVLTAAIEVTALRIVAGFIAGSLAGAVLGLFMGSFWTVRTFFRPLVDFFRFITPIAWVAPATIWFGIGETAKLFLVVYATLFIVLINTMAGVSRVHRDRLRMARSFGAKPHQRFLWIEMPAAVPHLLTGMRLALGNAFMTVIGAELLAGNNGLGYLIYSSRVFFRSDTMFAGIIVLGVMGFIVDRLFAIVQDGMLVRYRHGH